MGLFGLRRGTNGQTKEQKKTNKAKEKMANDHKKNMDTILLLQKRMDKNPGPITFAEALKGHYRGWKDPSSYLMGIIIADNMILDGTTSAESEHFRKTVLEKIYQDISKYKLSWELKSYVISELRQNLSYTSLLSDNPKSVSDMKNILKQRAKIFVDYVKLSADYQKLFEGFMVRYPPQKILQAGMGQFISQTTDNMEGYSVEQVITMISDFSDESNRGELEKEQGDFLEMFFKAADGCDDVSLQSMQRSVDLQERFFDDFFKLYELLIEENVILSIPMFVTILVSSVYDSHAKKLEHDILGEDPKNISDFIHAFLVHYPVEKERLRLTSQFRTILKQNNIFLSTKEIVAEIHLAEKKLQRDSFKKSLLSGKARKTVSDLDVLGGIEFEHFLVEIFEKMGYECEVTKASGDFGADLLISKVGVRTVVQAKRYDDKVSPKAVQEAVAAIRQYDANDAMVVTTNYFTKGAASLADSNNVKLIDRNKLEEWLKQYQI
jgi:HJR/Mrr/RecB family endonuclease